MMVSMVRQQLMAVLLEISKEIYPFFECFCLLGLVDTQHSFESL